MPADHHIRHAEVYIEGCYLCKLRSQNVAPSATPSRTGGAKAAATNAVAKAWDKDIPAFRRLVKDGLSPRGVDGAHELEARSA